MYNIFRAYEADLIGVGIDDTGIDVDAVEEELKKNPKVKMIYTIPS